MDGVTREVLKTYKKVSPHHKNDTNALFILLRNDINFQIIYGVTKNHKSRRFLVITKLFENFTSPETMVFVVLGATLQEKKC